MNCPITFLLGAGASYPYGVPMMAAFYSEFRAYLERRHPHCFALMRTIESHADRSKPDLETLLSDLHSVLAVGAGLSLMGKDQATTMGDASVARELQGYLDAFIVDRCERFNWEKATRELPALLDLREVGPLWIFSTNYDRVVEHACDAHGVAWCDGFEAGSPNAVANWIGEFEKDVRLVKLHGSVNWYEDDPGGDLHRLDRGYSLPGSDFRLVRGAQRLKSLMIIPTLEKEALGDPYIGLAVRFTDILKESRVLIVAGNSLRDKHIKAYIKERLRTLHVLIVSPSASQHQASLGNPDRTHALNAGFSEFLTFGRAALLELAKSVAAGDEAGVGEAVGRFIATVSRDVEDQSSISGDPALASLWKQLDEASPPKRIEAVRSLGGYHHPAVRRRVTLALSGDASAAVRVAAVGALIRVAQQEAATALGGALLNDPSPDVQLEVILALKHLGDTGENREWLSKGLARPDLGPAVKSTLQEALHSPEEAKVAG
jgi:HEAT repeat protein/SIR2-like protein